MIPETDQSLTFRKQWPILPLNIIAVSDVAQLEKIKQESSALPENFRKALGFWDAFEVKEIHEKLNDVVSSIEKLKLVRSEFEQ